MKKIKAWAGIVRHPITKTPINNSGMKGIQWAGNDCGHLAIFRTHFAAGANGFKKSDRVRVEINIL